MADEPGKPVNATAASLLGFLHHAPMTGWDLMQVAQQVIGNFWSLTPSQVYRELAAMAQVGLIRAGTRGRRDRQPYTITERGRTAFAAWIAQPPAKETLRIPLLLSVAFGGHLEPTALAVLLRDQRPAHQQRLDDYAARRTAATEARPAADPYALATLEFGIRHEQAVLDWFDALPDLLPLPAPDAERLNSKD